MMPSPPLKNCVSFFVGVGGHCVGKYWSFGVVYFDHGDGGMQINHFVFQSPRHICTLSLGGYCRL